MWNEEGNDQPHKWQWAMKCGMVMSNGGGGKPEMSL